LLLTLFTLVTNGNIIRFIGWPNKVQSHYSIWQQRMRWYAHTLAYPDIRYGYFRHTSCTFQIRWHTSLYVVLYAEAKLFVWTCSKFISVYRIYVSHMLTTRTEYAEYASHTPNTLDGRYSYVLRTLLSIYTYGWTWACAFMVNIGK